MTTPKKTAWQRARKPEQKAERIDAILEAAGQLLEQHGLEGTGLNAIARQAGLSKPNLYVYFESREAILLQLLLKEAETWAKALRKKLDQIPQPGNVKAVAKAFSESMARRRRFCLLFASVATVFEHNVTPDTVADFKRQFVAIGQPGLMGIRTHFPSLSEAEVFEALGLFIMSAAGLWAHCHPAPAVQAVLKLPEFEYMKLDFKTSTRNLVENYLRGLLSSQ